MKQIQFIIKSGELPKVLDRFPRIKEHAQRNSADAVLKSAAELVYFTKRFASGRPGPNVITGQYRDSIRIFLFTRLPETSIAVVGSDAPQGPRLELGFFGIDALGRVYEQPPYPHWRKAAAIVYPRFVARMRLFRRLL